MADQPTLSPEKMQQLRYAAASACRADDEPANWKQSYAEDVPRLIAEIELLRRRVEELERMLTEEIEMRDEVEADRDRLAAALIFYAARENYDEDCNLWDPDRGDRAREALAAGGAGETE